ncbi:MAG TPA: hypothetical protein VE172_02275 [Stackebrandtia sp.]|jgi:hypothetical protein|uniref:hypothetical protein n=1 Tax=Stackebrandtia sp. TaxID=2023065 RepID=UPI002D42434D|nr:hypothetical protein [Stackebrandtia sp.]HZE37613.1 hypothetical protein [Stackebrandtia sp.]
MDNRQRHYPFQLTRLHKPLAWYTAAMVITALVAAVGLLVDDRLITGAPAWAKPLKFSLSFIFYGGTLAILLPMVRKAPRFVWWVGTVIVAASTIEMVAIVGQVIRGHASHFNNTTPLDALVFQIMGATVVVLWTATLVASIMLWRQPIGDRALTWSLRLGSVISLVGMALAGLMLGPKPGQIADGAKMIGAHTVNAADGGPGLPILGWSSVHGDLRIPHFVGMHGLQILPVLALVLAWWAGRRSGRLADEATRTRLIGVAAFAYAGLTALVTWQALDDEPLLRPGAATVGGLAVLVAIVAGALVTVLRKGSRVPDAPSAAREQEEPARAS